MGKKQAIKQAQQVVKPTKPVQIQVEQEKQEVPEQSGNGLDKFLSYNKYIVKKTKLITKKKNQAIEFIKLDKFQVAKAAEALKKFDEQHTTVNLFSEDGFVYLELDLARVPSTYSIRPVQVELPVPIYSEKYNSRFTIISTDPESAYTDKIQDLNIPMIAEVIGYEKLKKSYKQNKDKLKLISANDLFFCDWKLYNLLRPALGKAFYEKKRYPYPIDCEDVPENLKSKFATYEEYLNDLANHTYFMMGNGPVYTLKIGRVSMQASELVKNIMRGVYRVIPHILGHELSPSDIRQISIKTFNSPSLPIYSYIDKSQIAAYKNQEKKIISAAKQSQKKVPAPVKQEKKVQKKVNKQK